MSSTHSPLPQPSAEDPGQDPTIGTQAAAKGAEGPTLTEPVEAIPLKNLTVRELLGQLTGVEDQLRSVPFWVDTQGVRKVNPAVAQLLARQRAIAEQLRARRVSWTAGEGGRQRSAAWPSPPWT